MSSSSQNRAPVSSTRAFADLAAVIDRKVSSDRAADLLANFRTAVRAEAAAERDALQGRLNRVMDICDEAERAGRAQVDVRRVHAAALGDDVRKDGVR